MSPKKSSGTPAIHQALQDRQITSPDRITEGLLLEIYKLKDSRGPRASSSDGGFSDDERDDVGVGPSHTTPRATPRAVHRDVACHNLWSDAESAREVVAWLRAIRNKKRKTLGVANSNEAAAKGKERARDGECNEDECCSNPRCLNWLGQARWEDGESTLGEKGQEEGQVGAVGRRCSCRVKSTNDTRATQILTGPSFSTSSSSSPSKTRQTRLP